MDRAKKRTPKMSCTLLKYLIDPIKLYNIKAVFIIAYRYLITIFGLL